MTDTGEVEDGAGSDPRKASHPWQQAAVVTALVVVALAAYVWVTWPPGYVGRTESGILEYAGCETAFTLNRPDAPNGFREATGDKHWYTSGSVGVESLSGRLTGSEGTDGIRGRAHFTSASRAVFTADNGQTVRLVLRKSELVPGQTYSCGIIGAN
jgi:hypothetical protein